MREPVCPTTKAFLSSSLSFRLSGHVAVLLAVLWTVNDEREISSRQMSKRLKSGTERKKKRPSALFSVCFALDFDFKLEVLVDV